ncbi:MAG TPA: methionyl-tRNA formyltransferase [Clostridiaceae bacterium]|jgi:methionyl-tRNA formyltransferase|nr:methionyl-tRNA formyltransferase [Clostridiaceae bacterium]
MTIRYAFMGTPEFATVILDYLEMSSLLPSLIITQPDRPRGRGHKLTPPPVALWAKERDIPLMQPSNCRDKALYITLLKLRPEVIVTASFGQYLPETILTLPEKGCLNVHASLLPKYRGASPIQSAIMAGEKETGVTLMLMDKGIDTGPVLAQAKYLLDDEINAGELHCALANLGGELIACELPRYLSGELEAIDQDESMATETKRLRKRDGCIDFQRSARDVHNHIRAVSPWPGAYTFLDGKRYKLLRARVHDCGDFPCGDPGEIVVKGNRMFISCVGGVIELLDIQPQSGVKMCVRECAHNFKCGTIFRNTEEP